MLGATINQNQLVTKFVGNDQFEIAINPQECGPVFTVALAAYDRFENDEVRLTVLEYDGVLYVGNTPDWPAMAEAISDEIGVDVPEMERVWTMFSVVYNMEADTVTFNMPSLLDDPAFPREAADSFKTRFDELVADGSLERLFADGLVAEAINSPKH